MKVVLTETQYKFSRIFVSDDGETFLIYDGVTGTEIISLGSQSLEISKSADYFDNEEPFELTSMVKLTGHLFWTKDTNQNIVFKS